MFNLPYPNSLKTLYPEHQTFTSPNPLYHCKCLSFILKLNRPNVNKPKKTTIEISSAMAHPTKPIHPIEILPEEFLKS